MQWLSLMGIILFGVTLVFKLWLGSVITLILIVVELVFIGGSRNFMVRNLSGRRIAMIVPNPDEIRRYLEAWGVVIVEENNNPEVIIRHKFLGAESDSGATVYEISLCGKDWPTKRVAFDHPRDLPEVIAEQWSFTYVR